MWYIDVTYGGEKYRGVYFRTYRPMSVLYESAYDYSMQAVHGYYPYHVYWFKYEPISWTILDESKGLILCDLIIDSQEYYSGNTREIDGQTIYRNNYEYSNIRAWLNDDFYNTVFSLKEQNIIKITEVDNGERSVKNNNEEYWYGIQNTYFSNNTFDKVFLLSYQEVTNESYGFDSWYGQNGKRAKESTEYAKSQGVAWSGDWWLRSPSYDQDVDVYDVDGTGNIGPFNYVYYTLGGVVPALCIEL